MDVLYFRGNTCWTHTHRHVTYVAIGHIYAIYAMRPKKHRFDLWTWDRQTIRQADERMDTSFAKCS